FTSEFGKGSGGSRVLWSSGVTVNVHHAVCDRLIVPPARLSQATRCVSGFLMLRHHHDQTPWVL
ncbi:hypothetical protein, partial [Halomonas sp. KHS3]|uniref:hypothetical protein n=1 Tax=Halomonas sp. KHS3 TaxID=866350 RepID=UPI001F29AA0D